ncbi:MAG TPA: sodium:proton antiporter, partial [Candidatus Nesterenkonia stercoripullorum]|nr:sodium:proton antiporter [Candidatus Nesterenkonia stercoripullorum]
MTELLNHVVLSVLTLIALSLSRVNVIIALLLAALVGGVTAGLGITETFTILIEGLGGQGETALSYILLGTMAVVVSRSGITQRLVDRVLPLLSGKRAFVLFSIAGLACFSQNLIPVHIAFIPILIPPLLSAFNRLGIDRRAVATALTFGLKAPYLLIPVGFGLIFQTIVVDAMNENGMEIALSDIPLAMVIPVAGMVLGLCVAVLISYRKNRVYATTADDAGPATPSPAVSAAGSSRRGWPMKDIVVLVSLAVALVLQLVFESLVIAALGGLLVIFIFRAERWRDGDDVVAKGVAMMGTIAFIMLVASGYAQVLTETGAVEDLVA